MRVGNIQRHQRYPRCRNFVRNNRRHLLINLKFDHQVHPLLNELLGHFHRRCAVIAIVQNRQVHARLVGRCLQARRHRF